MWDLICKPLSEGGILFNEGINLLIFKSPNNDMLSKIELICPTHHGSSEFFTMSKPTLMVYSENNFFEPLCKLTKKTSSRFIVKKFHTSQTFKTLKKSGIYSIIKKIKTILRESCIPKKSIQSYDFISNISANEIINIIRPQGYTISKQVININFKTIGIYISTDTGNFYLPCKPSSMVKNIQTIFVNEISNYESYEKTKNFLEIIYGISNKNIKSKPVKKIVNDEHIVGIITISNQFVPVFPERFERNNDDLSVETTFKIENPLNLDRKLLKSKKKDIERKVIIKKIELENSFYNIFRNTFKIIINYRQNSEKKLELKNIIHNPVLTYVEKMNQLRVIIQNIMNKVVKFQKIKLRTLSEYDDMISCIGLNAENCRQNKNCILREEHGICKLILPKKNFYSKTENKIYYYVKISDELIRFSKIRKYIFTPKSFLSFNHVNYEINKDEIVILEEILDKYFDHVVLQKESHFVNTQNVYDLTEPVMSINYSENYDFDQEKKSKTKKSKTKKSKTKKSKTKKLGKTRL